MINSTKKKVLLIDGSSFCYRAFYAIRSLTTSKGQPTNAVYGFVAMLNKLLAVHKPDYLAVAFDLKGPTFRHQRFTEYKAQRKPMPDELSVQLPIIKEVLAAYRIPIFEQSGYEADDIIATLATKLAKTGSEVSIITGDKDLLQIVNQAIKVINPQKDDLVLDETWVRRRFGSSPEKIVEIMALAGDATDNIPGVPGIGEATAIELIKRFGSLEAVLANVDKINNQARGAKIKEFAQQARLSRELACLDLNVPALVQKDTSLLLESLKVVEADKEKLFELFKELEFKLLMQKVSPESSNIVGTKIVSCPKEIEELVQAVSSKANVALYLWCTSLEPMQAKILGLAFSIEQGSGYFFPFQPDQLDKVKPILENPEIKKTGHDLKYAKVVLSNYGVNLQGINFDTMLAAYLINPEMAKFSLNDLTLEYLNSNSPAAGKPMSDKEAAGICSQHVTAILQLSRILYKRLKEVHLFELFQNIEMPLIEVLADMEREGVALDKNFFLHLSSEFEKRLNILTKEIYELAGEEFNINSPKQLQFILFEKLKLSRIKRTKTGSSTDTEVLQKLSLKHPIASSLLEFRELSKLKSTYIDGLIKLIHPKTGKIHTSFNQAATATGRLSSSRPNLQNIPIKTELGRKIRQGFITEKKTDLLLSADYSQIELRLLAHLSGDRNLISAFKEDLDIHRLSASLIFGVSQDKVTPQMRDTAKTVNFGITYGMSAFGLAKDLKVEQNRAEEFIQAYFQRYPGVKEYIAQQIKKAKKDGFVTTILKRRRYLPQIESENENIRQFAQRAAINAPVQGSAADMIKAAMIEIFRSLKEKGLLARMLLQVHDELVFSVPQGELKEAERLIKENMESVIRLKVPIKVTIKVGKSWLEME